MAVVGSNLTTSGSSTDATSYTTASVSPTPNALVLVWVYSISASAPNTPTLSGASMTWVEVANVDNAGVRKGTLFRAMSSSPGSEAITIDFGGQTQTGCAWSVGEFTDVETGGNQGSQAVVQAVTNGTSSTVTDLTVTMAAFSSADNATYGAFGIPLNTAGLPDMGSGFTELGQQNQSTPNLAIVSGWREDNDTTVDSTWSPASVPPVGVGVEIKMAVPASFAVTANTSTGFEISLSSPPIGVVWGKIKQAGTFVDILDRRFKVGGTFVSAVGYKIKVSGSFVDLV